MIQEKQSGARLPISIATLPLPEMILRTKKLSTVTAGGAPSLELFGAVSDLIMTAVAQSSTEEDLPSLFEELMKSGALSEDQLLDILWICDLELQKHAPKESEEAGSETVDQLDNLSDLINDLLRMEALSYNKVMVRLDTALLAKCGQIDLKTFTRRSARILTKSTYEQHKYNLFREESEGYSKLVVFLLGLKNQSPGTIVTNNILSLIGYFDLDPNRVADIVLECFIYNHNNDVYLEILRQFKRDYLPHILGFKIHKYGELSDCGEGVDLARKSPKDILSDKITTPENLYRITAKLIKQDLITLEEIWAHLSPTDELIEEEYLKKSAATFKSVKDIFCPTLTFKSDEIDKEKLEQTENRQYIKTQYLKALLRQNDFHDFQKGFKAIGHIIDIASHSPLIQVIFDMIEWFMEPVYRFMSTSLLSLKKPKIFIFEESLDESTSYKEFKRVENFDLNQIISSEEQAQKLVEFLSKMDQILKISKCYFGFSPLALTKFMRLIGFVNAKILSRKKSDIGETGIKEETVVTIREQIYGLIGQHVLPSLPNMDSNPSIVSLIWKVVETYGYFKRYQMYEDWITKNVSILLFTCFEYDQWRMRLLIVQLYPNIRIIHKIGGILTMTERFLKIISNKKEEDKSNARLFAKLSHNCPIVVFHHTLQQLKNFRNLIPVIITSLNYCSNLSLDIMTFLVLKNISRVGEKVLKEEEGTVKASFMNLTYFLGLLVKKHYKIDLEGIFVFLSNRLCSESFYDHLNIILLNEILAKMSGYEAFQNFTDMQLSSLAGGIALQTEAFKLTDQVRSARKSSKALAEFLQIKDNFVEVCGDSGEEYLISLPLYLISLISQQKNRLLYSSRFRSPVTINFLYDKMNETLIQFNLFLNYHFDSHSSFSELLLPQTLELMIKDWKISPELAFQTFRKKTKPLHKIKGEEWATLVAQCSQLFNDVEYTNVYSNRGIENDKLSPFLQQQRKLIWKTMSPDFFTLFWIMEVSDVTVPKQAYSNQIKEMHKEIQRYEANKDRSDSKAGKIIERIKRSIEILKGEEKKLIKEREKVQDLVKSLKEKVLLNLNIDGLKLEAFLQFCLLPRLRLSPENSIYCSRFTMFILELKGCGFKKSIEVIHNIIITLLPSVQCCSESEGYNLGVFIQDLLKIVSNWNNSQKFYSGMNDKAGIKERLSNKEAFKVRSMVVNMFKKFCGKVILLLKSNNFIQVRNISIILNRIKNVFPDTKENLDKVLDVFEKKFDEKKKNKDSVDTQANSYKVALKTMRKDLPSVDSNNKTKGTYSHGGSGTNDSSRHHSNNADNNGQRSGQGSSYAGNSRVDKKRSNRTHYRESRDRKKPSKSQNRIKDAITKKKRSNKPDEGYSRVDKKRNSRDSRGRHMNSHKHRNSKVHDNSSGGKVYLDKRVDFPPYARI